MVYFGLKHCLAVWVEDLRCLNWSAKVIFEFQFSTYCSYRNCPILWGKCTYMRACLRWDDIGHTIWNKAWWFFCLTVWCHTMRLFFLLSWFVWMSKTEISIFVDFQFTSLATIILLLKWNQINDLRSVVSRVGLSSLKRDVIHVFKLSLISSSLFFVNV